MIAAAHTKQSATRQEIVQFAVCLLNLGKVPGTSSQRGEIGRGRGDVVFVPHTRVTCAPLLPSPLTIQLSPANRLYLMSASLEIVLSAQWRLVFTLFSWKPFVELGHPTSYSSFTLVPILPFVLI